MRERERRVSTAQERIRCSTIRLLREQRGEGKREGKGELLLSEEHL